MAVLAIAVGALSACGSSARPPPTTTTTASSTQATSTTTTSDRPDASIDGAQIDRLPNVPGAGAPPARPDLSTLSGQMTFLEGVFDDIQGVWRRSFAASGIPFEPAHLDLFESAVSTACGEESADIGPFYCSGDRTVYLDVRFFRSLEAHFGVSGDFAEAFVVAHEFGHHVQNLLGITARAAAATDASPSSGNAVSVRVELQADCFAGVWAHSTYRRNLLEPGDIAEALHAAQVIGDDFLEHASGAPVDPDSWTHGSSAQRQHWFTVGFQQGRPDVCDTFAAG